MSRKKSRKRIVLILAGLVAAAGVVLIGIVLVIYTALRRDPLLALYDENCAVCHGAELEGAPQGTPLIGVDLVHGDSLAQISKGIAEGFPQRGMPAWSATLNPAQIQGLAIYISERRLGRTLTDFKVDAPLTIPQGTVKSELHDFRIEVVATNLDPWPYSIAPLPDGRILLTEKKLGLSIISPDGEKSELIEGTPETDGYGIEIGSLEYGIGWLMDVVIHPEYERNGWIYLHHGDLCSECSEEDRDSLIPRTMNRLIRGRIEDGAWVEEEVIWRADPATYSPTPDIAAGGRTAIDDRGYVFISVGIKGSSNYMGVQDLSRRTAKSIGCTTMGASRATTPSSTFRAP